MAKTILHYSSFGLTMGPKKFETILGTSSFFSVVSHGITHMSAFRHMLRPDTWDAFEWTDELKREFEAAKEKIVEAVQDGVSSFDIS